MKDSVVGFGYTDQGLTSSSDLPSITSTIRDAFQDYVFDVVVSFYNEGQGVSDAHAKLSRVREYLPIKNFIYVNNGSRDDTLSRLEGVARIDPSVVIVDVPGSRGYGDGYRAGILRASADFVLTNHADSQFDASGFLQNNWRLINDVIAYQGCVLPKRSKRPWLDTFCTWILRNLISLILRRRMGEFNGQPKLFPRQAIVEHLASAPHDFTFDLWLCNKLRDHVIVQPPVLQQAREFGESSWNRGVGARWRLFRQYLQFAFVLLKSERVSK